MFVSLNIMQTEQVIAQQQGRQAPHLYTMFAQERLELQLLYFLFHPLDTLSEKQEVPVWQTCSAL